MQESGAAKGLLADISECHNMPSACKLTRLDLSGQKSGQVGQVSAYCRIDFPNSNHELDKRRHRQVKEKSSAAHLKRQLSDI